MPGPTPERPRAQRLTDIEPQAAKGLGCNRNEEFGTPVSSGSNMGSVARFPKLDECAHFHYEHVELGELDVTVTEVPSDGGFAVRVTSGDTCWTLQRSFENFVMFDKQLHRCIFDRKFSSLVKLPDIQPENSAELLTTYLERFSQLNHEGVNCGPVLNWLQLDNRGRRILVPESDSCPINTPAVAAAYAVRPYTAQAQDEISFQIGDMISVIDMPPPGESNWWRGKKGFAVGFFPAECVAVIGDKVPRHLTVSTTVRSKLPVKPVLRKHGKLIAFFRSFILNRPSRRRLKQSGILRERVFGCDLGEHLLNSGHDVPAVLTCCAEFIETHGLVDGIYRLSGVTSNIQRLRHAFDEDRVPALHSDESILQDIHSVASLLKMYFRELPNPLCTYQLYSTFVSAVQAQTDAERLRRMRDAVRKLPPPHYRTLEFLMRHLVRVAARGAETGMTPRNVAIVWAPNLLRCKELEVGGVAALQGVGVQAVVTEFLVCYAELIFGDHNAIGRPKSLAFTTPSRLLSLEEARNRNTLKNDSEYIEVGAGPKGLPVQYHTVIELPRKRNGSKRSPSLNWRAIFWRPASGVQAKRDRARQSGTPPQIESIPNSVNTMRRLRPVKSADSLDGEDSLGPLLNSASNRPCGHSRSVSHDSYFDHLADAPSSSSPLDLSEIQLNFDLEEREMRMFSEEEGGAASVEASPRRTRTEAPVCLGTSGGSKRKRSRLEERLHCDVELRFIDSQSPDQVMVAADIHGMDAGETPSPLTTPGYLPLLSEASTPISPATLQPTPLSVSPTNLSRGSRISFRSFTYPLEIGESLDTTEVKKTTELLTKTTDYHENAARNLKISTSQRNNVKFELISGISVPNSGKISAIDTQQDQEMTQCDTLGISLIRIDKDSTVRDIKEAKSEVMNEAMEGSSDNSQDQEMTQCDQVITQCNISSLQDSQLLTNPEDDTVEDEKLVSHILDVMNNVLDGSSGLRGLQDDEQMNQSSSPTDLDSPMSCEHTIEDLPDSGFVICDSSEKMFTNTDTQPLATHTNDSGEWVMIERTTESITTPSSELSSLKDPLEGTVNPAIASDLPRNRSTSDNVSRTSLDLTMGSTVDTDPSCIGASDFTESPILIQEGADMSFEVGQMMKNPKNENLSFGENSKNESLKSESGFDRQNGNQNAGSMDSESSYRPQPNDNEKEPNEDKNDNEKEINYKEIVDHEEKFGMEEDEDQGRGNFVRGTRSEEFHVGVSTQRSLQRAHKTFQSHFNQFSKHVDDLKRNINLGNSGIRSDLGNARIRSHEDEVVIPSEHAAEALEIAHDPEGASEATSLDSSCTFSNASSPIDDSIVLRDTAAILQELALQRLSGGIVSDLPIISMTKKDRKNLESEIGRDIVRERKMRLEAECARVKSDEPSKNSNNSNSQYLPPCLRARHARATRAALSRSLDEGKFNRMTSESSRMPSKQSSDDSQHNSTPNVGKLSSSQSAEKLQSRNLGGIDLGDPRCRERIEKYKEERRMFLRDKYRSESFRGSTSRGDEGGEQALLARLKQRASRPTMH